MRANLERNFRHFCSDQKSSLKLDFVNNTSFKNKSTFALVRGLAVFSLCQIRPLVEKSEDLIKLSYKIFRRTITDAAMKSTIFGHFCAGENTKEIEPTVKHLDENGIGAILDYAAEADVIKQPVSTHKLVQHPLNDHVTSRIYEYTNEKKCDEHTETFKVCINGAAESATSPNAKPFAAVKLTALGDPELLKIFSNTILQFKLLYTTRINKNDRPFLTREEFKESYNEVFDTVSGYTTSDEIYDMLDKDNDNRIDLIDWMTNIPIEEVDNLLTSKCRDKGGPLSRAMFNAEETVLFKNMHNRLLTLANLAESKGVRIMVDAEQTYFQPCIDYLVNRLMMKCNDSKVGVSYPVIFGTYQMYLKDSHQRLKMDIERAKRYNYTFAAKLVRGAYMVGEGQHAVENNLEYPVHDSIDDTHANYNNSMEYVIERIAQDISSRNGDEKRGRELEIMFATHNQHSVEHAVELIQEKQLDPKTCGIYFGQLLGMSDHLTYTLGAADYRAYKYVPFGKVSEVMPYLIRRAVENADALGGAKTEITMILKELRDRFRF